ncbi:MAG: DinB family protein [Candidatus Hodarchaeota archaeon]
MKGSEIFFHWNEVREGLENTLLSLTPNLLAYRPSVETMAIGDIFRHIAGAEVHWIQKVILNRWDTNARFVQKDYPSKEDLLQLLRQTHQPTLELLDSLAAKDLKRVCTRRDETFTVFWILWHVLEHEIHHKGQIFRDLRVMGHPVNESYGP